jgi:hypothetical protein
MTRACADGRLVRSDDIRFVLGRQREDLRPIAMGFREYSDAQWRALQISPCSTALRTTVGFPKATNNDFLRGAYRQPSTFGKWVASPRAFTPSRSADT